MILKYFTKNFYINCLLVLSIFFLDRFSKIYVINLNDNANAQDLFISQFLNIRLIWNEGVAFGFLSFEHDYFYNFLTVIISTVIVVVYIMIVNSNGIKKYGLLMIFGGAVGNLYDRIFFKAVPDFITFFMWDYKKRIQKSKKK